MQHCAVLKDKEGPWLTRLWDIRTRIQGSEQGDYGPTSPTTAGFLEGAKEQPAEVTAMDASVPYILVEWYLAYSADWRAEKDKSKRFHPEGNRLVVGIASTAVVPEQQSHVSNSQRVKGGRSAPEYSIRP